MSPNNKTAGDGRLRLRPNQPYLDHSNKAFIWPHVIDATITPREPEMRGVAGVLYISSILATVQRPLDSGSGTTMMSMKVLSTKSVIGSSPGASIVTLSCTIGQRENVRSYSPPYG